MLSGTDMRMLEFTGKGMIADTSNRVTLNVSGVRAATFATQQTAVANSIGNRNIDEYSYSVYEALWQCFYFVGR